MTEPIFPDRLADELLAGAADPSSLSPEVRGVAEVLAAAQQAPVADELSEMTAAVAAFQGIVTVPVSAPGVPEPSRSVSHMFSSRIPKRAAIIATATLLIAGTAAAAAGGALPSPFHGPVVEDVSGTTGTTETTTGGSDTTASETTTGSTDTSAPDTTTGATDTTAVGDDTGSTDVTETTVYPGRDYGLCTAWTHGAEKKLNPAFQYLADQAAADAAAGAPTDTATVASDPSEDEVRAGVDTYCEKVIADKKGTDDGTDDETESTDVENTVDGMQHGQSGNNGNGHGNGHGNGKNGKQHGKP